MKGIADTALGYKGKTRRELGLRCEETCAEFVSKVLVECGYSESSVSCNDLFKQMKKNEVRWSEPQDWMKKDDVIFFDWDGDADGDGRPLDHVGIVCSVDEVNVYYVNINGNDHDRVTVQSMKKSSKCIAYWLRPLNSPEKQDSSNDIDQIIVRFKDGSEKLYWEHFG